MSRFVKKVAHFLFMLTGSIYGKIAILTQAAGYW
jgi:hypothetical protein